MPDGYDLGEHDSSFATFNASHFTSVGRDELVGNATGDTEYSGNIYTTDACYVSGLLQNGTEGSFAFSALKPHAIKLTVSQVLITI